MAALEGLALIRRMADELSAGRPVAEAVVLASKGSVSRTAGTRMVLTSDGLFFGTVGGGAPEYQCQGLARKALEGADAVRVTLDHATTGSVCGGSQLVGVRRVDPSEAGAYARALADVDAGRTVHMVVDWQAARPEAFFSACEGCGAPGATGDPADGAVPEAARAVDAPSYRDGIYTEPLHAPDRAVVFGLGHVGRELVGLLARLDFDVVGFDDRPALARPEDFPGVHVICGDYGDIAATLPLRSTDYVCVMTHGHAADETVVAQALAAHPRYLGCMGSKKKRAVLEHVVGQKGFSPEEIATVELPIGLELGGSTPAEIAVEVAARLIQVRNS